MGSSKRKHHHNLRKHPTSSHDNTRVNSKYYNSNQQVEEIYTRTLHPFGSSGGKKVHPKNPHQHSFQTLQQQHSQLYDKPKHGMNDVYSVVRSGFHKPKGKNLFICFIR
jgi:hypothetical protein